jgi:hypothetical protein
METKNYTTGLIREFDRKAAEETRTVEFVISDDTRDRHGTVIPVDNWKLDRYNDNGIVGYQHNVYGGDGQPNPDHVLGIGRAAVEDGKLIGRVTFEPAEINPLAEKIFQKILHGTLKATSVGFRELEKGKWGDKERGEDISGEKATYYFGPVELLEFSIVNIPSNPNALRRELDEEIENKTKDLTENIQRLESEIKSLKEENTFIKKVLNFYQSRRGYKINN